MTELLPAEIQKMNIILFTHRIVSVPLCNQYSHNVETAADGEGHDTDQPVQIRPTRCVFANLSFFGCVRKIRS